MTETNPQPPQPPTASPATSSPQPVHDQAAPETSSSPLPPQTEKKKISKKLFLFLIFLALFLGSVGLLSATGAVKIPDRFSVSKPREETGPMVEQEVTSQTTASDQELPEDQYLQDSDNDGFPDFLEKGTGYDPFVVDCAKTANCQAAVGGNPKTDNNVLFILDSSGSMAGQVSGQTKMAIAKQAINAYIDRVPAEVKAGLMVYGHQGSNNQKDQAVSCSGIEILYPLGVIDKAAFKAKVASFQPTGWTPIADSLKKARDQVFTGREQDNNNIILVSDGIETCGGDPCAVARELKGLGISPTIDVIGFDVDAQAKTQLQCIARVTNGQYFDARTAEEFNQAFERLRNKTEEFEKVALCLNKNFEAFATCMDQQIIASMEYLDREKTAALDTGNNKKVAELDKIVNRLNEKYEQFLVGFEEEYTSGIEKLIEEYKQNNNPTSSEEYDIFEQLNP